MKEFEKGGFPNNENSNLFAQVDCDFIGNICGKPIAPHTSEKINETIHKAAEEEFHKRLCQFDALNRI